MYTSTKDGGHDPNKTPPWPSKPTDHSPTVAFVPRRLEKPSFQLLPVVKLSECIIIQNLYPATQRNKENVTRHLFLVLETRSANHVLGASEPHVEGALEGVQDLLVRLGGTILVLTKDVGSGVALLCKLVARQLGLHLLTLVHDELADFHADGLGLDDVGILIELLLALSLGVALGLKKRGKQGQHHVKSLGLSCVCHQDRLTALPTANFFSWPTMVPLRCAAFRAPLPRTTVSLAVAPPRALLPIVTVSQSDILTVVLVDESPRVW